MSYEITECVACGKTKCRVVLDSEYIFQLYNSEVRKYHIKQEGLLTQESFIEIQEILYKRGLSRCLHLIKDRDYTQADIEKKLRESDYPQDIIKKICERMITEGFINDERYAKNYVISHMKLKSRKQIIYALMSKGVNSEYIEAAFEDMQDLYGVDAEAENVKKLLIKKIGAANPADFEYEDRMKIFAYLGRKGYEYELIKKVWEQLID